ncbi:MAG TPA: nucleotide excision repair endonuclease [Prosthecobacter sp.]|nr:nucleotide excision repair endonuclease [Prosthecobacter sp.]
MTSPDLQETPPRPRQLRLLEVGNPLTARFGAAYFQSLPRQPGVYFFYDAGDRLLYIGQSCDLRARVGSYRHVTPERHPRRTLRLVHRIARIEFTLCPSQPDAQQLEAALLLERRPPFNRAGVWQPPPWWLALTTDPAGLEIRLTRAPTPADACLGPLPSSFRYVHAALCRSLLRLLNPGLRLTDFPVGWLSPSLPPLLRLPLRPGHQHLIAGFVASQCDQLLAQFEAALAPENFPTLAEQSFWLEQWEYLYNFHNKKRPPVAAQFEPVNSPARDAQPTFL